MPANPDVAVIVPCHRSERTIGACLDSLMAQTLPNARFVVHLVDTDEDGTAGLIADRSGAWNGRLHYHRAEGHGPGRQRNLGVERAGARFLAFTDSDCEPDPGWLEAGVARLESGASIVQGPTLTPDGAAPPPFSHAIHVDHPSPLYESCNIMYEAGAFRRAGGFSVDLFDLSGSHMGEDTELAWRVLRGGGTAEFEQKALVRHVVHPPDYARHLRYQWQSRYFPRLFARVPELRGELLTVGLFLGSRSVRVSAALAGLAAGKRSPLGYALAVPYLVHVGRIAARARTPRAAVVGVAKHVIADTVREAALVWGSARYRSPVF